MKHGASHNHAAGMTVVTSKTPFEEPASCFLARVCEHQPTTDLAATRYSSLVPLPPPSSPLFPLPLPLFPPSPPFLPSPFSLPALRANPLSRPPAHASPTTCYVKGSKLIIRDLVFLHVSLFRIKMQNISSCVIRYTPFPAFQTQFIFHVAIAHIFSRQMEEKNIRQK